MIFKKNTFIFYKSSRYDDGKYGLIKNIQYVGFPKKYNGKTGNRIITVEWEDKGITQFKEDYLEGMIDSPYMSGWIELIDSKKGVLVHKLKSKITS